MRLRARLPSRGTSPLAIMAIDQLFEAAYTGPMGVRTGCAMQGHAPA